MEKDRVSRLIIDAAGGEKAGAPLVVFACEKSGARIIKSIPSGDALLEKMRWIELPCGGTLRTQYLLDAISRSPAIPERVVVLACHEDNCRSTIGTIKARGTVESVKSFLKSVGWDQTKVDFISTASNETARIRKLLAE
jgi:coenzyme F420-reducing hydrogenase delta subunit